MPTTPNPYKDQEYEKRRDASLGIIPRSSFLSAIKNNAGTIFSALTMTAVAAIVTGIIHVPVWGILTLVGAALVTAGVSAYAGYRDEKLSKTVGFGYSEARQIADARVNAREMATALDDTLGAEIKDIKKEHCQTQGAIAELQRQFASKVEQERLISAAQENATEAQCTR